VAAVALGRASVNQVVLLHDLAVGVTRPAAAPPGLDASQAAGLASTLAAEARQLTSPGAAAHTADISTLGSALAGYASLATQLAARPAADAAPLPAAFVTRLRKLDAAWRPAVKAVGSVGHVDLLAGMAPLLIPRSGA